MRAASSIGHFAVVLFAAAQGRRVSAFSQPCRSSSLTAHSSRSSLSQASQGWQRRPVAGREAFRDGGVSSRHRQFSDTIPSRLTTTASLAAVGPAAAAAAAAATSAATATVVATSPSASTVGAGGVAASLNSAAGSLAGAGPILSSLGVLTMVIALHEAGHLVAALSQGIKVEAFSIGFGPKLLSYRKDVDDVGRAGGSSSGGFLKGKLSGPSWDWGSKVEENSSEAAAVVEKKASGSGGWWGSGKKKEDDIKIEEIKGPEGVEYTLRAIPLGGFVSFPNNYEMDEKGVITEYDDPNLLSNRGPGSRAIVIAAGVVVNFALAWACIFGSVSTTGIVQPRFAPGVVVNEITDSRGGAAIAGLRPKDVFLSVNGNALAGDSTSLERAVQAIRSSDGKPVTVELARDGDKTVKRTVQTTLGSSGKYTIGVRLAPHMEAVERRKAGSPVEAAEVAFSETTKLAGKTLESFTHLVSTGDMQGVSGPVEIVKVGAEVATEDGAAALLQFAAVISVNLAVINSLPVPGLDGGQMVFVLAELARGKKLERGVTEAINGFALLVLLTISLSTFAGDLGIGTLFQRIVSGGVK